MSELINLTAREMAAGIAAKQFSVAELMVATLAQIERANPELNAIVSLRDPDDLMAEARRADNGLSTGPLHGLPIAVKDLVETKGIRTTHGSPIFADLVPQEDQLVASRLRQAGAILIGKTNVPEFGLGSHSYNPVFGVTRNPFDTTRTAGGSSGGAGAALAGRMLALADGSDAMGSLRNPAGWCGVFSLRPTWGVVPPEPGGEAFLNQLSTTGPMARNAGDLRMLLEVMAGSDPRFPNPRSLEGPDTGSPMRIGWLADWGGALPMEAGIIDTCARALRGLEDAGHWIEIVPAPFSRDALWESWTTLRSWNVAGSRRKHFENPDEKALLKPAMLWEIERGLAFSALDIYRASEIRSDWFRRAVEVFSEFDALVLPTAQMWPFPAEWDWPREIAGTAMDTYHRWMEVTIPVSLLGLPAVTVPAGAGPEGLPIGLQIFGPRGSDLRLLALAEGGY